MSTTSEKRKPPKQKRISVLDEDDEEEGEKVIIPEPEGSVFSKIPGVAREEKTDVVVDERSSLSSSDEEKKKKMVFVIFTIKGGRTFTLRLKDFMNKIGLLSYVYAKDTDAQDIVDRAISKCNISTGSLDNLQRIEVRLKEELDSTFFSDFSTDDIVSLIQTGMTRAEKERDSKERELGIPNEDEVYIFDVLMKKILLFSYLHCSYYRMYRKTLSRIFNTVYDIEKVRRTLGIVSDFELPEKGDAFDQVFRNCWEKTENKEKLETRKIGDFGSEVSVSVKMT